MAVCVSPIERGVRVLQRHLASRIGLLLVWHFELLGILGSHVVFLIVSILLILQNDKRRLHEVLSALLSHVLVVLVPQLSVVSVDLLLRHEACLLLFGVVIDLEV